MTLYLIQDARFFHRVQYQNHDTQDGIFSMKKIRIILADDHDLLHECLATLAIRDDCGIQFVGNVKNGYDLLKVVRNVKCDIILLDIIMPGPDSLDILKTLKIEFPHIPVLIVSGLPEDGFAVRYLKAGASGYFSKERSFDELFQSIRKVFNGQTAISSSISKKMVLKALQKETPVTHELLSDREYQVMCLMSSGKTLSEVAKELCLSPKTISTYRNIILEKMGWKNNAQMMFYCISHGLCDPHLQVKELIHFQAKDYTVPWVNKGI